MIKLAAGCILTIALALAEVSAVSAQGPDIQMQLECVDAAEVAGIQELVVIENRGDAVQEFAGWQLQSDPSGSEVFDLSVLGGLEPGASVFIQSGPSASGIFNWGLEFIFRDNDPTDYVRLVDETGAVVQQIPCPGEVVAQPSPTPSADPSLPDDVPNGGGPPPPPGDALSAAMMVLVGGSAAVVGVAAVGLSRLGGRSARVMSPTDTFAPWEAADRMRTNRRGRGGSRGEPISMGLGRMAVGLVAVAAVLLLLRHRLR